ncbi:hypothetical protein [Ideonella sp.]|uniref:hypothetical protein n=1 Tax=Ideonella sp. TaxID=1929293 RepID=UPI003BB6BBFD
MLKRERFAWAWLLGLIVVPLLYFMAVAAAERAGDPSPLARIGLLAAALSALAVVALAARFLPSTSADEPSRFEGDERDQHIERHSSSVAYLVLMAGMIVVGFVMPFSKSGWQLVHAAFLAIVAAEVVRYGMMLLAYRRGGHD